ncbi:MAG: hypothetical protein FJW66_00335 [Actinobacteria bacterium]|nr:hypothetical protein [Actinomycetota bacterium]
MKKEFLFYFEVKEKNGNRIKYPVYKDSKNYYISSHSVPAGKTLDDEIRDFFEAEPIGPVFDRPLHQDLKFKI